MTGQAFTIQCGSIGKIYRWDKELYQDYWISIHGVIGYRYQKKDGIILRAGFTPFYRPYVGFLPLIGLSIGYSW